MAGIPLEKMVIIILVMSAFVIGISNFTGDLYSRYPASQNVSYFEASSDTMQAVSKMQNKIQTNPEATSIIDIMLNGVWQMFTILFDVLKIFMSLITDTIGVFNIPSEFAGIFGAIITVIIIFGIAYAVMNMPR